MTRRLLFSLIMIFGLLLGGCNLASGIAPHTPTPRAAWLTKFLEYPVCQPPCWENITPDQTTMAEAKAILAANPAIKITHERPKDIGWEFIPNEGQGSFHSLDNTPTVVDIIGLSLSPGQTLTLGEVINSYPNPTHIRFAQNSHNLRKCFVAIYFEPLELELSALNLPCKETKQGSTSIVKLVVSPEAEVYYFSLGISPGSFSAHAEPGAILEWSGYGEYVGYNVGYK